MLCPKCSLPTVLDVQTVFDAVRVSDRVDEHGVPLPHRRHCAYHHDLWVGVVSPETATAPRRCHEHRMPRPCRVCAARYAVRRARALAQSEDTRRPRRPRSRSARSASA
jgi:hypothetical protein